MWRAAAGRPRLLAAIACFALAFAALPIPVLSTRSLVAWNLASGLYLALILCMFVRGEHEAMRRRADREDAGAGLALCVSVAAAVASFGATLAELRGAKAAEGDGGQAWRLALVGTTVLVSWLFTHAAFAVHYAHDYYAGTTDRGGLKFPGPDRPDYWDFLYFSLNLGAAAQTSDVQITGRRMRRFALVHTLVAFLFNTTVLAFAINVAAGVI